MSSAALTGIGKRSTEAYELRKQCSLEVDQKIENVLKNTSLCADAFGQPSSQDLKKLSEKRNEWHLLLGTQGSGMILFSSLSLAGVLPKALLLGIIGCASGGLAIPILTTITGAALLVYTAYKRITKDSKDLNDAKTLSLLQSDVSRSVEVINETKEILLSAQAPEEIESAQKSMAQEESNLRALSKKCKNLMLSRGMPLFIPFSDRPLFVDPYYDRAYALHIYTRLHLPEEKDRMVQRKMSASLQAARTQPPLTESY